MLVKYIHSLERLRCQSVTNFGPNPDFSFFRFSQTTAQEQTVHECTYKASLTCTKYYQDG